jgi:hypothetical protein
MAELTPFLCPHCGDPKDFLILAGEVEMEGEEDDGDYNITVCNLCMGLIVWPVGGGAETLRGATGEEAWAFRATDLGGRVFAHALRRNIARLARNRRQV